MKKLVLSLLVLFCLVGCKQKEEIELYKTIDSFENKTIECVDMYDDTLGLATSFYDEETINLLTNSFKEIKVVDELKEEFGIPNITMSFYYPDGSFTVFCLLEDKASIENSDGSLKYFQVTNYSNIVSDIYNSLCSQYNLNVEYYEIVNDKGIKVSQGEYEEYDGEISIEFEIENATDKPCALIVVPTINNYPIHSNQEFICIENENVGYFVNIPTKMLKEYGVNNINKLDYVVEIYDYDYEQNSRQDLILTGNGSIVFDESLVEDRLDRNTVYQDDAVTIDVKMQENETNTNLMLYVEGNATIGIDRLVINGEDYDIEGYKDIYSFEVEDCKFALLPLGNYIYDEESASVTKIEIESLEVKFNIDDTTTDLITIK